MPEHPGWKAPLSTIREQVALATDIRPMREGAMRALDAIQFTKPSQQLDSLFLLAVSMATVIGLDPHEMVSRAHRMIPDAELFSENMRAARDYAKGELK